MSDRSPLPPLRELFADASARVVWTAIESLSTAAQHEILKALQQLLALPTRLDSHRTRVAHAITCLRDVAELLGHSPTSSEYREVRASHPELKLPADGTLQGWLGGSWNDALKQARLDAVPGGDILVREYGPAIESEEILQAVRDCADELQTIPTYNQYLRWARRPDVKARPGRRPSSQPPFDRAFGGYLEALKQSGVVNGETLTKVPRSTQVRLGTYFVGEDAACDALRFVAERIGHSPRVREYIVEREKVIEETRAAGDPKSLPAPTTIQYRFDTWDDALVAAGLQPLGGRSTYSVKGDRGGRKGPQIPTEDVVAVLREAYDALGDPFTMDAYKQWRVDQRARDVAERRSRRLPSVDVVRSRFGLWENSTKIARGEDPDDGAAGALEPAA